MKKSLFLVLLLTFVKSQAQLISLKDLIRIESDEQFERIFIENNYEKYNDNKSETISYKFESIETNQDINSAIYSSFLVNKSEIYISYEKEKVIWYNRLFDKVKRTCRFIYVSDGRAYYQCADNKLKKIGLKKNGDKGEIVISDYNEISFPFSLIKKINSKDRFKGFCSRYGFNLDEEKEYFIGYSLGRDLYGNRKILADYWPEEYNENFFTRFTLTFRRSHQGQTSLIFENLLTEVKLQCEYWGILEVGGSKLEYECYSCSDVDYDGKIGFLRGQTQDMIRIIKSNIFDKL